MTWKEKWAHPAVLLCGPNRCGFLLGPSLTSSRVLHHTIPVCARFPIIFPQIRVKTPTYGTVALDVNKDETVDEVKRLTQEWEGHQPGVLMFGSKQLQNGLTPDESTVDRRVDEMACGPVGAGLSKSFVDVSGSSGPRKHALKDNAPDWRSAEPGLCLEGECDNSHCEAYGEMVIVNHGFETFNLMNERTFRCPQCKANSVVPTTCGFFSCRWSFCGRKVGETITLIGQWKEVVEGYHRFDEEQGEVEWDVLRVMAFPLLPKPEERAAATGNEERRVDHTWNFCTLCNATISVSEEIVLPECGHRFHAKCLKIDEGDGNGSGSGGGSGSGSGDVNGNGKGKGKQKAKEKGTGKGWVKGSSVVCPTCREKSSLPLKV